MHRGSVVAALVVAAGLALSGCEVVGSIDIDTNGVDVDLRMIGTSQECSGLEPLSTTFTMLEDGRFVCHVAGRALWQDLPDDFGTPWVNRLPTQPHDAIFLTAPGWAFHVYRVDRIDLYVSTPGPIVAVHPDTAPLGNAVHITDTAGFTDTGLSVVGSMRSEDSARTTALLSGTVLGLVLGAVGTSWILRRRTRVSTREEALTDEGEIAAAHAPAPARSARSRAPSPPVRDATTGIEDRP